MDFRKIKPGEWNKVGRLEVDQVGAGEPVTFQNSHVLFADGWCYVEVDETDGEGSVNVYPAGRVRAAFNVHEADQSPRSRARILS
ncbi:hypothetical protein ACI784_15230 [Geodermatophilus sp. SYSU D01186]